MSRYKCPDCGANLDAGEKCDCNVSAESAIEALCASAQPMESDMGKETAVVMRKVVITEKGIIKPCDLDIVKLFNWVYGFVITLKPIPDKKLKSIERITVKMEKRKKALHQKVKVPKKKNKPCELYHK